MVTVSHEQAKAFAYAVACVYMVSIIQSTEKSEQEMLDATAQFNSLYRQMNAHWQRALDADPRWFESFCAHLREHGVEFHPQRGMHLH